MGELGHRPGVRSVGLANNIPFSGANGKSAVAVVGHVLRPGESPRGHYAYGVGGDYFSAMGFSLRAGRFLTGADSRRAVRVCVVDEDFARYYWPYGSALGHRLFRGAEVGPDAEAFTVVGVVGSIKQSGLTDDAAQGAVYYPYIYRPDSDLFVAVRSAVQPDSLQTALRGAVRTIDPELAVIDIQSMEGRIAESLVDRRSPALLGGCFSGIALLLVAIGVYGVLSYAVTQRRREIGVRMALGATRRKLVWLVLREAMTMVVVGVVLGIPVAIGASRGLRTLLFEVTSVDPLSLLVTAFVLAFVAAFAAFVPARRATRVDPMVALRYE